MKRGNLAILLGIAVVLATILAANRHVFLPGQGPRAGQPPAVPLPPAFPADFPIYPGAAYQGAEEAQGQINGRSYDRGWFEIREDSQKVIAWYDGQLASAGYAPVATFDEGYSRRYGFAADKGVAQVEIFIERDKNKPTTFSVDFFAGSR